MPHRSRRHFLISSAALATGTLASRSARAWGSHWYGDLLAPRLAPLGLFDYGDVQLLDGPMLVQFRHHHELLMGLDNDSLLKPFRQLGGMPAPGEDLGGWYSPSEKFNLAGDFVGFVPGHCFGQWMSALSRAYSITGDKATQEKVQQLVSGFGPTITPTFYDGYRLPGYTFDKTNCGLIDAHQFAGDPAALDVLNSATDAALQHLPEKALSREEMMARPHHDISYTWDETYTLPENFYLAYQRGAGARYRQLAARFLEDDTYFNPLAEDRNVLPGLHAYSHVNALSSAMQAYLVDGSEKHLRAAQNGFRFVQEQSFATGGWGPNEGFQKPDTDDLAQTLHSSHASFETPCGAYGHFKIARYLMRITGDSTYGDSMEAVLHNAILGAPLTQADGSTFYYSDYNATATKVMSVNRWPCCSGTFPQLAADYGISSYLRSPNAVYVNLYVPSRVTWTQGAARVSLMQETTYPRTGETSLHLSLDRKERFSVALRIPAWAGPHTEVLINGHRAGVPLRPGTWAHLDRTWKDGDRIEISFDMPLRLIPLDARHPDLVALMRGPVALFAVEPGTSTFTRQQLLAAKPVGSTGGWTVQTKSGDVRMLPFPAIQSETYRLYQQT